MITQALLIWLVTYISFMAFFGFILYITRSFTARRWADRSILRATSLLAFVGATAFWIVLVIAD